VISKARWRPRRAVLPSPTRQAGTAVRAAVGRAVTLRAHRCGVVVLVPAVLAPPAHRNSSGERPGQSSPPTTSHLWSHVYVLSPSSWYPLAAPHDINSEWHEGQDSPLIWEAQRLPPRPDACAPGSRYTTACEPRRRKPWRRQIEVAIALTTAWCSRMTAVRRGGPVAAGAGCAPDAAG